MQSLSKSGRDWGPWREYWGGEGYRGEPSLMTHTHSPPRTHWYEASSARQYAAQPWSRLVITSIWKVLLWCWWLTEIRRSTLQLHIWWIQKPDTYTHPHTHMHAGERQIAEKLLSIKASPRSCATLMLLMTSSIMTRRHRRGFRSWRVREKSYRLNETGVTVSTLYCIHSLP